MKLFNNDHISYPRTDNTVVTDLTRITEYDFRYNAMSYSDSISS